MNKIAHKFFFILLITLSAASAEEAVQPLVRLQQYKPIYFLAGKPDTKLQLSFKIQFIQNFDLYTGFTQLLMWDLFKPSAPFRDVNYNPELFYRIFFNRESARWLDLGLYEHESNGRDGPSSRSWDRLYLLFHSAHNVSERTRFLWSIKGWFPFNYDPLNRDFPEHRGIWELNLTLSDFLGPFFGQNELTLRLYPGGRYYTNPLKGGQELTIRTKTTIKALGPMLIFQVFHGYAENMLDYKDEHLGLRGGVSF